MPLAGQANCPASGGQHVTCGEKLVPTLLSSHISSPVHLQTLGPTNCLCPSIFPVYTERWEA